MSSNRQPDYHKRLRVTVLGIIILSVVGILSVTIFSTQIAYLFSLLSKHRNDPGEITVIKPTPPMFSNIKEATKDTTVTLEGYAEPGSTVKLFINGPEKQSVVTDNEGIFTFTDVQLIQGRNTIFAKLVDSEGVESDPSPTYNLLVDTKAPEVEIEEPDNEDTVRNLDSRIKIEGKADEKASIKINDFNVIQKPDLTFSYSLGAKEGWNDIKIVVEDVAGNQKVEELKVRYVRSGE